MKARLWPFALSLLAGTGISHAELPDSDPQAVAIADQVMAALGGQERWDALAGLRWSFQSVSNDTVRSERRHAWDRRGGWHRVEGKNRQGQPFLFIHRLDSAEGKAWVGGTPMEGDTLPKLVKRANSMWINDTYWMLMPYKLRDPGVRLKYAGDTTLAGVAYDRLALSFENVGDTPGDRYWVYVNRANHRVERWDYLLQGNAPPPVSWTWEGWEEHGGLWFPTVHRNGNDEIRTTNIETPTGFPPGTFAAP